MTEHIRSDIPAEQPDGNLNTALFHLSEVARGIDALNGLRRLRNSQTSKKHPKMTPEMLAQRMTLMDISIRVLETELHSDLDFAAESWLRVRGRLK